MKATIIALLATIILSSTVAAQDSTVLGRWVRSQPPHVQKRIGCDLRPPYSRHCWEHVVVDGKIIGHINYRQDIGHVVVTRVRYGR